jgi:hypothetical protein
MSAKDHVLVELIFCQLRQRIVHNIEETQKSEQYVIGSQFHPFFVYIQTSMSSQNGPTTLLNGENLTVCVHHLGAQRALEAEPVLRRLESRSSLIAGSCRSFWDVSLELYTWRHGRSASRDESDPEDEPSRDREGTSTFFVAEWRSGQQRVQCFVIRFYLLALMLGERFGRCRVNLIGSGHGVASEHIAKQLFYSESILS